MTGLERNMEKEKQTAKELYSWLRTLVCVCLGMVLLFTFVVRLIRVDGESMRETLQDGDILVAVSRYLAGDLSQGDIVIVRDEYFKDGQPIVKRVIATEGQTVDIDFEAGIVYVDGQALDEPYINEATALRGDETFPQEVQPGHYFVMGDNRNHSEDSRFSSLGQVAKQDIVGEAYFRLLPFGGFGKVG